MKYKIKYSDVKGGSTSEIQETIDLNSLESLVKYHLLATDYLEANGEEKKMLEGVRDGSCTNLFNDGCLKNEHLIKVNKRNRIFLNLARDFKDNYLGSLDNSEDIKDKYFYVYRFICLETDDFGKKILYPSIFSSSWDLNFVKDWIGDRKGIIQKIKVKQNTKFIATSYPHKENIIIEGEDRFITIEESLKKLFLSKNGFNKHMIGEYNKPKIKILNQGEHEVLLPPGVTKYLGSFIIDDFLISDDNNQPITKEIKIYNYEFEETPETPENLTNDMVNISCQRGTIFDNDEDIQLNNSSTSL